MTDDSYRESHRPAREFVKREDYLNHELEIMRPRRWALNLPFRDYRFEIEDLVPAMAATIGKIVMVTAMVSVFAAAYGLSADFVAENVRWEMLIAAVFFVFLCSGLFNPRANLAGTHGPMIPMIPLLVAAGGHPLAFGLLVGVFGLALSLSKGGSKLVVLTGPGVKGGLLIYLGAYGLVQQMKAFQSWSNDIDMPMVAFTLLMVTVLIYALLARVKMRWMSIPLCSAVAGILAYLLGVPFEFSTEAGLPHMSPAYWWGQDTGWKLGLPDTQSFIAALPFAVLAVAMWSPDFIGHRVFQELNYPPKATRVLMDVDDTMEVASVRQLVGTGLGGGNLASSWGTYMIPASIAKRPIPAGANVTALMCIICALWGAPMDLAMWQPVLRIALIVGVFMPLLEAGMEMIKDTKTAQGAGIVIFLSALVNPVFGWSLTMFIDNSGLLGKCRRSESLVFRDRYVIPLVAFAICAGAMFYVGLIPRMSF
jgi:hypothetical protein